MRPTKAILALVAVMASVIASEPVLARGHGGGHSGSRSGGHSHGHRATHAHRVIVGSVVFLPGYFYPPYAPPVGAPPAPMGYIEQGTDSYYCAETQKNYPDTPNCPGAWQLITPVPTPGS